MRVIDQLAALQTIDTELDADRKRYAEIQAALKPPASLQQAQAAYDEASARLKHWQKERRQCETATADQNAKIQTQEKRLYGGNVKDPREQVALQQNVEALKRHLGTLEEAELEAILEMEQAEGDVVGTGTTLENEQTAWARQEATLQQEREALILHARQLKAQRETAAAELPAATRKQYETLRQKLGGVAVARLQGAGCGGCGAALPTALRQQTHSSELIVCPICGRMLVDR